MALLSTFPLHAHNLALFTTSTHQKLLIRSWDLSARLRLPSQVHGLRAEQLQLHSATACAAGMRAPRRAAVRGLIAEVEYYGPDRHSEQGFISFLLIHIPRSTI